MDCQIERCLASGYFQKKTVVCLNLTLTSAIYLRQLAIWPTFITAAYVLGWADNASRHCGTQVDFNSAKNHVTKGVARFALI